MKKLLIIALLIGTGLSTAAQAQQALVTPNGSTTKVVGSYPADTEATLSLSLTTLNNSQVVNLVGSCIVRFSTTGITSSTATVQVQGQTTSGAWTGGLIIENSTPTQVSASLTTDATSYWVPTAGYTALRFIVTTAGTGTAAISVNSSPSPMNAVFLLPYTGGSASAGLFNIAGNAATATHTSGTTSATAGVSTTIIGAGSVTKGMVLQNTCGTAEWFSTSLAAGTALTATNSMTLAAGASFTTPDWYPVSGAWTIASATAVACTYVADYK